MKAAVRDGTRDVRTETVPDPEIEQPRRRRHLCHVVGAVRVRSVPVRGPGGLMNQGDILRHDPMGIVEETGTAVTGLAPGDRVARPLQVSCEQCPMCEVDCKPSATTPGTRSRC